MMLNTRCDSSGCPTLLLAPALLFLYDCIREQQEELSDTYHDNATLLNAGKRAAVLRIGPAGDGPGNQPLMEASNLRLDPQSFGQKSRLFRCEEIRFPSLCRSRVRSL